MSLFLKAQRCPAGPRPTNSNVTKHPHVTPERVARYFDQESAGYADAYSLLNTPSAFFYSRRQAIVMCFLRSLESGLILDIGCGPGIYAKPCTDQGFRYYGLDVSPQMIDEARRRFGDLSNVEFASGDARKLPLPSNHADGLLCLGMLEYVSPEEETACLAEMARVLKPGGVLIFSFLNARSPFWIWRRYFPIIKFIVKNLKAIVRCSERVSFMSCIVDDLPARRFTPKERTRLLRSIGLTVTENIYFSINIFPSPLDARYPSQLFRVSSRLERLLRWRIFKLLGMGFIIVAQKPT